MKLSALAAFGFYLLAGVAFAAPPASPFQAGVDRPEIGQDESVVLTMKLELSTGSAADAPTFDAPDFIVVNQFNGSDMETRYDGNTRSFSTLIRQTFTRMLRPRQVGKFKIQGIQVRVGNKVYTAPDIPIEVVAGGAKTPPPPHYGSQGGLRGAARRGSGPDVLIRAEINKEKVYKGEQVVVSYYMYRRVRVGQIEVAKFPELKGFLREDLDMPVMGQRLEHERVMLDGNPYDRSLLVRYAAYPLQEGKLRLDPLSMKYVYYPSRGNGFDDGEDPFLGFFSQLTPQTGTGRSDVVTIEVMPLPDEGRPANFTGAVGRFQAIATVDRTDVKVNDAITLALKIEGRGNLAAIGEPKIKWPDGIEYYESHGQVKNAQGGGAKIFEIVLIPRKPGPYVLPGVPVGFFDPETKAYRVASSDPIQINVQPAAPGSTPGLAAGGSTNVVETPAARPIPTKRGADIRGMLEASVGPGGLMVWIYRAAMALAGLLLLGLAIDGLRRWQRARVPRKDASEGRLQRKTMKDLEKIRAVARKAAAGKDSVSGPDLIRAYEGLSGLLFDALDRLFQVGARALPRSELRARLVGDGGLPEDLWGRIDRILEYGETLRYASGSGVVTEASARKELSRWVNETETSLRLLERWKSPESREKQPQNDRQDPAIDI